MVARMHAVYLLAPGLLLLLETRGTWFGYLWLVLASVYFFFRCLVDLALVRRPVLTANLNLAGLVWLAGALFISLIGVAVRQPANREESEKGERYDICASSLPPLRNWWRFRDSESFSEKS